MKILVVDDDSKIRNIIKEYASLENHIIFESGDGKSTFEILKKEEVDLIILDLMLPDISGYDIARKVLSEKEIPILMLSAKGEENDKLEGFNSGAIDYITKPFSPKELMARLKVIQKKKNENIYIFDGVLIDRSSKKVYVDKKEIVMTLKEYELLDYLILNKNILLDRESILNTVWGDDFYGTDRTIDTHVKMIRKKLNKYGKHIVTVRGGGYRFE
jgi:DNA-binding response OmpR family regulator